MLMKPRNSCYLLALLIIAGCSPDEQQKNWSVYIESIGTYSSARTADLNNDGTPDIVMGAGGKEEKYSAQAVIALDGKSGKTLWSVPGQNQYVGSPVFTDVDGDKIPDVFIGGRWAQLSAISGSTGKLIWSFYPERTTVDGSDGGWFNFTTPQLVPDQDKDGIQDLLIANGGDARAKPGDPNRPAGRLLVLGSKTGKILANVAVPDGKETYMSVVCEQRGNSMFVLFGTGGETLGGHLYRTTLADIMKGDISNATALAVSDKKGFVSSPVLADLNNDKVSDVIVNAVDGRMIAINGTNDSVMWTVAFPGTEAYTIPGVGLFTDDDVPDLFGNFAIGTFPVLTRSIRFMVDGSSGKIIYQDSIPSFQYASTIAADLNGDGRDEAIVNQSEMKKTQFNYKYYSYLIAFDFKNHRNYGIGDTVQATNFASTPWIGDINNDNRFDIIYSSVKYDDVKLDLEQPRGLHVSLFQTGIDIKRKPRWSAFMGTSGTGVY